MAVMKFSTLALLMVAACAVFATSASAATNYDVKKIPVSGNVLFNGAKVPVSGFLSIVKFAQGAAGGFYPGKLVAVGKLTLNGVTGIDPTILNDPAFSSYLSAVEIPVANIDAVSADNKIVSNTGFLGRRRVLQAGTCKVLSLVLGPLDVSLLGLNIMLDKVVLLITASPLGGLLGSLLCALTGPLSILQSIGLLNQLLGLLGL